MPRLVGSVLAVCLLFFSAQSAAASGNGHEASAGVGASTGPGTATISVSARGDSNGDSDHSGGGATTHTITCSLYLVAGTSPVGGPVLTGSEVTAPVAGTTYGKFCHDTATTAPATGEVIIFEPAPPDPAVVAANLAQQALAQITLPTPAITSNPQDGLAVINIPVWLWVGDWTTQSASASAGGVTATVSAAPQQVRWDMGDSHEVVCHGPGAPYDTKRSPDQQHTDCSYSYGNKVGDLTVTAIESWHVTYTATNGQTGDLGVLTRTATMAEHVHQLVTTIQHAPGD